MNSGFISNPEDYFLTPPVKPEVKPEVKAVKSIELSAYEGRLLQLVMIVKDAATCIVETLETYKPVISSWFILDTGSLDNTVELVEKSLKGIPGKIVTQTFPEKDFKLMRNTAMELARENYPAAYMIMPDDSYLLKGGTKLVKILNLLLEKPEAQAVQIKVKDYGQEYITTRIVATQANLKWERRVHEMISVELENLCYLKEPEIYFYDNVNPTLISRSAERRTSDLKLLMLDYMDDPQDVRTWFYIATTYYTMIDRYRDSAIDWFRKRFEHGATSLVDEELFETIRYLVILEDKPLEIKVAEYLASGLEACPYRAPELYWVFIERYLRRAEIKPAAFLLEKARQYPYPHNSLLFVDKDVYEHFIPGNYKLMLERYPKILTELASEPAPISIAKIKPILLLVAEELPAFISEYLDLLREKYRLLIYADNYVSKAKDLSVSIKKLSHFLATNLIAIDYCWLLNDAKYLPYLNQAITVQNVYYLVATDKLDTNLVCSPRNFRKFLTTDSALQYNLHINYNIPLELISVLDKKGILNIFS